HLRIVFPSKHRYPPSYACNYEGMARSLQQTNGFGGVMETPVTLDPLCANMKSLGSTQFVLYGRHILRK
ncbi:hypothetical protein, partial [Rhizobium leguminosarum]|uniref:hypothetical protein n=1 Tax=Rhizobium leguminosarum TaxID=384 RepID=UPI001C98AD70